MNEQVGLGQFGPQGGAGSGIPYNEAALIASAEEVAAQAAAAAAPPSATLAKYTYIPSPAEGALPLLIPGATVVPFAPTNNADCQVLFVGDSAVQVQFGSVPGGITDAQLVSLMQMYITGIDMAVMVAPTGFHFTFNGLLYRVRVKMTAWTSGDTSMPTYIDSPNPMGVKGYLYEPAAWLDVCTPGAAAAPPAVAASSNTGFIIAGVIGAGVLGAAAWWLLK